LAQNHHIDKYRVVIQTSDEDKRTGISNELQSIKSETFQILEKLFDKYIPEDKLIELNKIELDLGSFSQATFKEEFHRRLIEILEAELKQLVNESAFKSVVKRSPKYLSDDFELLTHYLLKGYVPKQYDERFDPDELVEKLMVVDKQRLSKSLEKVWLSKSAKERMARQLKPRTYKQLRALVSGATIGRDQQVLEGSYNELFEEYIVTGVLPPWYESYTVLRLESFFSNLSGSQQRKLVRQMFQWMKRPEARKRIAAAFTLTALKKAFATTVELQPSLKQLDVLTRHLKLVPFSTGDSSTTYKDLWLTFLVSKDKPTEKAKALSDLLEASVFSRKDEKKKRQAVEQVLKEELRDPKLLQSYEKLDKQKEVQADSSLMSVFMRFMEKGVLPRDIQFHELLDTLISTHAVLLAKMLHKKWHLFPVRYRLSYQTKIDQLIKVIPMLYGDTIYLSLFEAYFDHLPDQLDVTTLPEKARRDIYFAFFNTLSSSESEPLTEEQFHEMFLLELAVVVPALRSDEIQKKLTSKTDFSKIGEQVVKALSQSDETYQAEQFDLKQIWKEILTEGEQSEVYQQTFKKAKAWNQFLKQSISDDIITTPFFLSTSVDESFWQSVLPKSEVELLHQLFETLTIFQLNQVEDSIDELASLEKTLALKSGTIYPVSKEIYIELIEALVHSRFAVSSARLIEELFRLTFEKLEKQLGKSTYKRAVEQLLSINENQAFGVQYPNLSKWLSHHDHFSEFIADKKEPQTGVKTAFKKKHDNADLVAHYLKKGKLPDWSSFKSKKEVVELLHQKIDRKEFDWLDKLRPINTEASQRLVDNLKATSFKKLITFINPLESEDLLESLLDLKQWTEKTASVKTSAQKAESFLRLSVFQILLESLSSSSESAVRHLLRLVAEEYDISYFSLVDLLFKEQASFESKALQKVVSIEHSKLVKPQTITWRKSGVKSSEVAYMAEDIVAHFLKTGRVPSWSKLKGKNELRKLIQEGLKYSPELLFYTILKAASVKPAIPNLVSLLKAAELSKLIRITETEKHQWVEHLVADLVVFHQQSSLFTDAEIAFKKNVYSVLLRELLVTYGRLIREDEFVEAVMQALVSVYGVKPERIYAENAELYSKFKDDSFKNWVKKNADQETRTDWLAKGIKKKFVNAFTSSDLLLYYLRTEKFPEWSSFTTKKQLQDVLSEAIEKRVVDVSDILFEVKDDYVAKRNLIEILKDQELHAILRSLDNYHFKLYKPILDDIQKAKAFEQAVRIKKSELKRYLQVLFFSEIIKGDPYLSAETFATHVITQTAKQFSLNVEDLFHTLEESWGELKSKPLQKAIKDHREAVPVAEESKEVAVEANINALLYMMEHRSVPWWHIKRTKKRASLKTEKQRLYKLLLKDNLHQLLETIQHSGKETYYLGELFEDTSIHEFNRIVSDLAPGVSGFVIMYTRVLEALSKTSFEKLTFPTSKKVYSHIYQYVRVNKSGFTASGFVDDVSRYAAFYLKADEQVLINELVTTTKLLAEKGEPKFKTLLEVLQHIEPTAEKEQAADELSTIYESQVEEEIRSENELINVLRYYLQYGAIPLRAEVDSYKALIELFDQEQKDNEQELRSVLTTIFRKRVAVERILHHGPSLLLKSAATLFDRSTKEVEVWFKGIIDFVQTGFAVSKSKAEALAIKVLLKAAASPHTKFDLKVLNKLFFVEAKTVITDFETNLLQTIQQYKPAPQVTKSFAEALQKSVEQAPKVKEKKVVKEEEVDPLEGMVEVHNAGAVILANFLPRYFDMLQMTEKRAFKDEQAAARAVHLVQYLVSGETETPEHELVLNKVLCGVDLEYPVELSIDLTDKEKEISESLLKGVMQNWDKLKSNSIEALREAFLMRTGYINETPHNWELKVESSGRDILIDFLPWSIGTIKLSWMKKSLNVEWRK